MTVRRVIAITGAALTTALLATTSHAAVVPSQYIVALKGGTNSEAVAQAHAGMGAEVLAVYGRAFQGYAARLSTDELRLVRADPRVLFVAPDTVVTAASQALPTGIDRVDGELSSTGSGDGMGAVNVNVAVLDTGIDVDHPDLNVVGGKRCVGNANGSPDDDNGHGTAVAGVIGARDNAAAAVGIAPGTPLWAVKVLNKHATGNKSQILCGIEWVTATRTDANPANDIAVANMSIVGPGSDDGNCGLTNHDPLHVAICASVDAGVTYVVAAGNDGVDFADGLLASYDEVLTVTALWDSDGEPGGLNAGSFPFPELDFCTNNDDVVPIFSEFATLPSDQAHTIAAPGVCINSTSNDGGAGLWWSGTSFSAPHVAGTAALCIQNGACAGLTPRQVIQKLRLDAERYNTTTGTGYGFAGDPQRPTPGRYYGYLIRAAEY